MKLVVENQQMIIALLQKEGNTVSREHHCGEEKKKMRIF